MDIFCYLYLDVFVVSFGGGNYLGVVIDVCGWSDVQMQCFVCWINLVEIIFLLLFIVFNVSYCVCMFMLIKEIVFVGYFSVGSVYVVLVCGFVVLYDGLLWQECQVGVLLICVQGDGDVCQLLLCLFVVSVFVIGVDVYFLLFVVWVGVMIGGFVLVLVDGGCCWWIVECVDEVSLCGWQLDYVVIVVFGQVSDSMGICVFVCSVFGEGY